MAFCQKCGQQIDQNLISCPYCGAKNVANPYYKQTSFPGNILEKFKKLNTRGIAIIGGGALGVIVLIILLVCLLSGGKDGAVESQYEAMYEGSKGAVEDLAPSETWDEMEDEYSVEFKEVYEEFEDMAEENQEELEDEFGKNASLSYEIVYENEVKKSTFNEMKDWLKEYAGIDKGDVKDAVTVGVVVTAKGAKGTESHCSEITLVKIGGTWYTYSGIRNVVWASQSAAND